MGFLSSPKDKAEKEFTRQGGRLERINVIRADLLLDNGDTIQILDAPNSQVRYLFGSNSVQIINGVLTWQRKQP